MASYNIRNSYLKVAIRYYL